MTELFDEYARDLLRLQAEIDQALAPPCAADREQGISDAEQLLRQSDSVLKQMDLEAKTLPSAVRATIEPTLRQCREGLVERKKMMDATREAAARCSLLGVEGISTVYGKSLHERERMLSANGKLEKASAALADACRVANETEALGKDVMSDLKFQGDLISRVSHNVHEVGSNYGVAKRILVSMQRRQNMNQFMTRGIAVFLFFTIVAAGYLLFRPSGDSPGVGSGDGDAPATPHSGVSDGANG